MQSAPDCADGRTGDFISPGLPPAWQTHSGLTDSPSQHLDTREAVFQSRPPIRVPASRSGVHPKRLLASLACAVRSGLSSPHRSKPQEGSQTCRHTGRLAKLARDNFQPTHSPTTPLTYIVRSFGVFDHYWSCFQLYVASTRFWPPVARPPEGPATWLMKILLGNSIAFPMSQSPRR